MAFVVKKPESSNRTIRMPNSLIARIGELATKKGISFNQLVIQCCEYALEDLQDDIIQEKEADE